MRFAVTEDPCIRHMLPGRVRVYVPGWAGKGKRTIETGLRLIEGVRRAQANPLTGTVLIDYDPTVTDVQIILHEVRALDLEKINALDKDPPPPPVQMEKRSRTVRARIAVRGLDHDPDLARLVVERLACRPGVVQVKVNWLTGRVLVEFFEHKENVDDLIAEVVGLELPARPEENRPSHPLDLGALAAKRSAHDWCQPWSGLARGPAPRWSASRAPRLKRRTAGRQRDRDCAGHPPSSLRLAPPRWSHSG